MNIFDYLTPAVYAALMLLWGFILLFCSQRLWKHRFENRLVTILLIVLAMDALRTFIESTYFGIWFSARARLLPESWYDYLSQAHMVFMPKLLNLVVVGLIILVILYRWLPQEERELQRQQQRTSELEAQVHKRTQELRLANEALAQDVAERVRSEQKRQLMMRELDHRVKNNLASIISMTEQMHKLYDDREHFVTSLLGRLRAMCGAHEALATGRWENADLKQIVMAVLEPHLKADPPRIHVNIPEQPTPIAPRVAQPLGLALHELATNAVKYGAMSDRQGHVELSWHVNGKHLHMDWIERCGQAITPPAQPGFGSQLIVGLISYELQGQATIDYPPTGLTCRITLPINNHLKQAD